MRALKHHGVLCGQTPCCIVLKLAVHHGHSHRLLPLCAPLLVDAAKQRDVGGRASLRRLNDPYPYYPYSIAVAALALRLMDDCYYLQQGTLDL